jgi:hypothetical protein
MLGWHFVTNDKRLGYGDGRIVAVGKTYTVPKNRPLEFCEYGLHASKRLIDALQYAPGSVICRVELSDRVIHGDDKAVGYKRRVIAMIEGEKVLHEFACRAAEYALTFVKNPDPRSIAAIQAKRDWLLCKINDCQLAAARDAARDAAGDAAWAAAGNAALAAAGNAALAAAWDAARDAARGAARGAARAAARGAARGAAWAAAWNKLNEILTEIVNAKIRNAGGGA